MGQESSSASELITLCKQRGLTLATAESCTAGGVASALGSVAGASAVLLGGIVAYDNRIKEQLLAVPLTLLEQHGAVSRAVAAAMASGAAKVMKADLTVSVTGIAGPTGGTPAKPVGTVFLAVHKRGEIVLEQHLTVSGTRTEIQAASVNAAIALLTRAVLELPA